MKAIIFVFVMVFSWIGTPALFAQEGESVTFKITNIPTKQGKVMFTTECGKHYGMVDATASAVEIKLDSISNGKYTIYVFHDANNNYTMDKTPDNVPIEFCATQKVEVTDRSRAFQIELVNIGDKVKKANK